MPDIRVLPVHRGGSSKVHHYSATFWFRGQPRLTRQGRTAEAAERSLRRAMAKLGFASGKVIKAATRVVGQGQRAPLGTSSNVAGKPVRIITTTGDRLIRKATR